MTYREKLKREHPDRLSEDYIGGCYSCPSDYGYQSRDCEKNCGGPTTPLCTKCWDQEIPGTEKPKETPNALPADIRQLIEAQIGKKDRYVSIFISENGISVDIYPYPFPEEDNK